MSAHKRLRDLGKTAPQKDSDTASTHSSQECSICLMSIAPCQSLFVAPCSHVWHYKCIRRILNDERTFPNFQCPNCRAIYDLDAEVDEPLDFPGQWAEDDDEVLRAQAEAGGHVIDENHLTREHTQVTTQDGGDVRSEDATVNITAPMPHALTAEGNVAAPAASAPQTIYSRRNPAAPETGEMRLPPSNNQYLRPITPTEPLMADELANGRNEEILVREGPMTPTNTAGPFLA